MPREPAISVVVCTCGRPAQLARALESLTAQSLPVDDYEVVVVDNHDGSGESVTRRFADRARVGCVREPRRGLSFARNTGVARAAAPIVAFLDDDAMASPSWLERMLAVFAGGWRPACVGGRVAPVFETPRPAWLPDELLAYFSVRDLSPRPFVLGGRDWLAGTNIAFLRRELLAVGGFSTRLGRRPGTLLSMEEVCVQRRMQARRQAVVYDPSILVHHHILAERLTRRWLHRRAFWQGISDAIADREDGRPLRRAARLAFRAGGLLARPWPLVSAALPLPPQRRRTTAECGALVRAGYLLARSR